MIVSRRRLFGFTAALAVAPAIVRASSLMPVSALAAPRAWIPARPYDPLDGHFLTIYETELVRELENRMWAAGSDHAAGGLATLFDGEPPRLYAINRERHFWTPLRADGAQNDAPKRSTQDRHKTSAGRED